MWPIEARWQLQLIAQQRLVWKEMEKGERTRLREGGREDGRRLALKSNEELCEKKMSIPVFPPAYSPTRGLEEERSAANTNEKEEFF